MCRSLTQDLCTQGPGDRHGHCHCDHGPERVAAAAKFILGELPCCAVLRQDLSVRELQEAAVQERKATNVGANFHPTLQECWEQLMGLAMSPDDEPT